MKETRMLMGMPVTIEIADRDPNPEHVEKAFSYFEYVDKKFSTYKPESEISRINRGELPQWDAWSADMRLVLELSEETKRMTAGYFDIVRADGTRDPSGLVKGWAIRNAANLLISLGCRNFYVDAGGDIQVHGTNGKGMPWHVGIRNPFSTREVIKTVTLGNDEGVATSGTYERGAHIYNPKEEKKTVTEIMSLTVIGPNVYEADRFATAAFAMGERGIAFVEGLPGFEGYMVDRSGRATMTKHFENYVQTHIAVHR